MYSRVQSVFLLLIALLVTGLGKLNFKQCFDGCSILDQVLTCTQLANDQLAKLSKCVERQHGTLIVDVRNNRLSCTCEFIEFAVKVNHQPRDIIFYDSICKSKRLMSCGATEGMGHTSTQGRPIYALIGGRVFDVTASDFENQLTNMDNKQTTIIAGLQKTSARKQYNIAQEEVMEKAIVDADSLSNPIIVQKEEVKIATANPTVVQVEEDDDANDKTKFEPKSEEYGYSTLEKEVFIFICFHVVLMTVMVIALITKNLQLSSNQELVKKASNRGIDGLPKTMEGNAHIKVHLQPTGQDLKDGNQYDRTKN